MAHARGGVRRTRRGRRLAKDGDGLGTDGVGANGKPTGWVAQVPADPEPPIPLEMPKELGVELGSKVSLDWLLAAIRAHARLRAKSFYDTGHFVSELLDRRALVGAANIKELCARLPLGMSHMTANKYLQISRSFARSVALKHGIEKCYALVVYARTIGRPADAGAILAEDEAVRGARGLRALAATPAQIFAAIRALKQAARDSKVPPAERARQERAAAATQRLFRRLGVRRVTAHVVRRGGQTEIALYVPLDVAESLAAVPAKKLARTGPALAAVLGAAARHARAG